MNGELRTQTWSVLIALGSNLGDRALNLRRAIAGLQRFVSIVRVSDFMETEPVDAPESSPDFLNGVVVGYTGLGPQALLTESIALERRLGRRRSIRNAPRIIDIDLILHSAHLLRTKSLTLPHPRYLQRDFVLVPLAELNLPWRDPITSLALAPA